jgi:predicted dithiol-disulfide oxidoreductase (DUF899 family)
MLDTAYMYLDLTPKGRNETGPRFNLMDWVLHHDNYDATAAGIATRSTCDCHQ